MCGKKNDGGKVLGGCLKNVAVKCMAKYGCLEMGVGKMCKVRYGDR